MLCVVATPFTNHKFFSKYFKSQFTITPSYGFRSLSHCFQTCTHTKTLSTYKCHLWESRNSQCGSEFELEFELDFEWDFQLNILYLLDSLSVFHLLFQLIIYNFIKVQFFITKSLPRSQALTSFIGYIKSDITHSSHNARLLHTYSASADEQLHILDRHISWSVRFLFVRMILSTRMYVLRFQVCSTILHTYYI